MDKKSFLMAGVLLFIGISIIFNGYFIGNAIKHNEFQYSSIPSSESNVLSMEQVAKYLNISEEEVQVIIRIEDNMLNKTGSFYGKMLPYFVVNNKQYFYKDEIDEWLKEVSSNHREYNTAEGWVLQ